MPVRCANKSALAFRGSAYRQCCLCGCALASIRLRHPILIGAGRESSSGAPACFPFGLTRAGTSRYAAAVDLGNRETPSRPPLEWADPVRLPEMKARVCVTTVSIVSGCEQKPTGSGTGRPERGDGCGRRGHRAVAPEVVLTWCPCSRTVLTVQTAFSVLRIRIILAPARPSGLKADCIFSPMYPDDPASGSAFTRPGTYESFALMPSAS